ncbi:uncharacterized protein DUF4738 [Flavobacteriaceae bacterium MAR_2010_72]|nr:uncharacterized protein DUF4738 [Flavobacteriaceae bacterium MAR_2010_72]TVZ59833.1 uncharacterized protein DUF4738 [Flavobacteriaceae bacterium MAR_2010_105]
MKYSIFIIILLILVFSSCDGRISKHESLKASVEKFKDSTGVIEIINYFPSDYSEQVTDTLLHNGNRVRIKAYTDMNHNVLNEFKDQSTLTKHYYRNYLAEILISKEGNTVFNKTMDKTVFIEHDPSLESYLKASTLHGVWLNQSKSINNGTFVIDFLFCKPETDTCFYFEMNIDEYGVFNIKEIEEKQ